MKAPTEAGERIEVPLPGGRLTMAFRYIPPGGFRMGSRGESPDEEPIHRVRIVRGFWLGETPITQGQFGLWKPAHENHFPGYPNHPAERLSWYDAVQFCEWLADIGGGQVPKGFRPCLPTEAEWEYACRAGTETDYYTGDGETSMDEAGWYSANSGGSTHPVGEKSPNLWGLRDMHGSVWEWCHDVLGPGDYRDRVDGSVDPTWQTRWEDWRAGMAAIKGSDPARVLRGGSWLEAAGKCRSAYRFRIWPDVRYWFGGFRVCLVRGPAGPHGAWEQAGQGEA